jgi:hypothetical protein
MSATAAQFTGMIASVVSSQDAEVILGKQPILADYGREVRNALNALPPEVSRGLTRDYREPTSQLVAAIEGAIVARELAIENSSQEVTLDKDWLAGGGGSRQIDESGLAAGDDWNSPREP